MAEPNTKLKVFLCHASEDNPNVRALYERLKADGFDPWLDREALLPGQDWDLEIQKAMRASGAVVVCFSSASVNKEGYVQKEIKYAQEIQKEKPEGTIFFIPLQLEACEMPFSLRGIQWGHYYEANGYEKLVQALNKRAEQLKAAQGVITPRKPPPAPIVQVRVDGNVNESVIVVGNRNTISLTQNGALAFQFLSDDFRRQQAERPGLPFYDGAMPNWSNIARGEDAERALYAEVMAFAQNPQAGAYKSALIVGLAGEGKSTLLRRLAWSLAEAGQPVFVRHGQHIVPPDPIPISSDKPLVLVFDDADQEDVLPKLAAELANNGVPFVILMAARLHEWRNANLEGQIKRLGSFRPFRLDRMNRQEAEALLDKLAQADKLDALQSLPRPKQIEHFLSRLKADGQLLPALLTARYGADGFENIIRTVLEKIRGWKEGDFLLHAYAALASIHRYNLWLTRRLFAETIGIPESEVGMRVIGPLEGELLAVQESDGERLLTRHPVIAERAMRILNEQRWAPEDIYLYQKLFETLANLLRQNPHGPQKKLLTILPLLLMRQGKFGEARQLFEQGTRADPTHAPTYQAWALMEQKLGQYERARQLFEQGTRADPTHAPTYQAWALMEQKLGQYERARQLFEQGTRADPTHVPTYQAWALMELRRSPQECLHILERGLRKVADPEGRASLLRLQGSAFARLKQFDQAQASFEQAIRLSPREPRNYYFTALQLLEPQGRLQEAAGHYRRALQLHPRPQDRKKIEEALARLQPRLPKS